MTKQESVIYVPLTKLDPVLAYISQAYDQVRSPDCLKAHMTLQYPWLEKEGVTREVMNDLRTLFKDQTSFNFQLTTAWFGDSVLILKPLDPQPFIEMTQAILRTWPDYPYYGGDYDEIEPHVTLAYGQAEDLKQIEDYISPLLEASYRCTHLEVATGIAGQMEYFDRIDLEVE